MAAAAAGVLLVETALILYLIRKLEQAKAWKGIDRIII